MNTVVPHFGKYAYRRVISRSRSNSSVVTRREPNHSVWRLAARSFHRSTVASAGRAILSRPYRRGETRTAHGRAWSIVNRIPISMGKSSDCSRSNVLHGSASEVRSVSNFLVARVETFQRTISLQPFELGQYDVRALLRRRVEIGFDKNSSSGRTYATPENNHLCV